MFYSIKLFFTDRERYEARKRYLNRQRAVRNELKKKAKDFCPWSGWYMHDMILTMLKFYHEVYEAKDCCWSESAWNGKVAASLKEALDMAAKLDQIDDFEYTELIKIAREDGEAFSQYVKQYEEKVGYLMDSEALFGGVAYNYLEKKYTTALYNIIGNHIWEWMD